ncbi:N-acetylmuramoyl-L-alanine amidase-like domain-containing protein [Dysgonomonas macrotermitis]|uniref:DUF1460 domain-containing protein n=1 Tax=Dysgonomonas macrotermitis TaxID=1346286 RepID=A0A1M5JF80_9BACT|nr:N-acetylmuramoyl-L-alanine amidase-like domain-containing protein [Dysgonomonas macrotermitis]SHG38683.1 Protein of unknown function [Dysgonomonas macrotermitis]
MKKAFYIIFLLCVSASYMNAQVSYTKQDSLIFEKYIATQRPNANLPINELVVKTALYFQDTPYVSHTLEKTEGEQLGINLREFDCTTFVESCIALSRTLKSGNLTFAAFCKQLQSIRYRNGVIQDYASRLHYMTDWTYENQKHGIFKNESQNLGGILDDRKINYMSAHINSYRILRTDKAMLQKITNMEQTMNKRGGHYVVLKQNINYLKDNIKDGDIIIFATSIEGLDYTHIGIAYHNNGQLTFIHASSKAAKVTVESNTLAAYCEKSTKGTGITVLRLNELKGK